MKMNPPTIEELRTVFERTRPDSANVRAALQRIKPSWTLTYRPDGEKDGSSHAFQRGAIQVLWSMSREADGHDWIHVSLCGRTGARNYHLPTYEDVQRVKRDFLGDAWAYQVFPDERHYINQNPFVLHLWSRFDGSPALPDFTHGLGTI